MRRDEAIASRALLALSKRSADAIDFLSERLRPLVLAEDRLRDLIAQLGSDDEWESAYLELEYFDPRLTMYLGKLMNLECVEPMRTRRRLVGVLSGYPFDQPELVYDVVHLHVDGKNFYGSNEGGDGGSWWAETDVSRLNERHSNPKAEWTRLARALALLEHFGTDEALGIVRGMASGHPDAHPTRFANEILRDRDLR